MPSRKDLANAIRILSIDAVQKAKSGHPGAPMGMADIAEVLWNDFLRHNPEDPSWPDRDRFVLSNGHASMLIYALLYLSGYDLSLEDIKNFRQLHSKTPGHPEYGLTPGIETTTGPLGQGIANAVGMAIAEEILGQRFNRPQMNIVNHYTYVFLGDGCLMEGVSHEVCSLAGTLGLGKLIALYDDNGISIDGSVQGWFDEDRATRFQAYGWQVIPEVDGHDSEQIYQALEQARQDKSRPTLICCKTKIAFGSPHMQGSHKTHGAPLGEEEVEAVRRNLNWEAPPFEIPSDILSSWDARAKGKKEQKQWEETFMNYTREHPQLASEYMRCINGEMPEDFENSCRELLQKLLQKKEDKATRKASGEVLEHFGPLLPEMVGGSADLSGSNNTKWSGALSLKKGDYAGNYIDFGVREFGMAAIMNGMALHQGIIPYSGTFLVFSDYSRNAMRMAALMGIRNIFVLTHDSIGVGEDGPTHQPVEHASSLRLIPGLKVWRPCDTVECAQAWIYALQQKNAPTALLLSRQKLSFQSRNKQAQENIARGGYVLSETQTDLQGIIIATGSEVDLAVQAAAELQNKGFGIRVVSMPCLEVFADQDKEYKNQVLPKEIKARVVIEAGSSLIWHKYAGDEGVIIGLDRFGESAPGNELFAYYGFTVDNVVQKMLELLQQ